MILRATRATDKEWTARFDALKLCARHPELRRVHAVGLVLRFVRDRVAVVRHEALILAGLDPAAHTEALAAGLEHNDAITRCVALRALSSGPVQPHLVARVLAMLWHNADSVVRHESAQLLLSFCARDADAARQLLEPHALMIIRSWAAQTDDLWLRFSARQMILHAEAAGH